MTQTWWPAYIRPGTADNWVRGIWRKNFFVILEQEAPKVRANLLQEVGPCFRNTVRELCRVLRSVPPEERDPVDIPGICLDESEISSTSLAVDWYFRAVERKDPIVRELTAQLQGWVERFKLTATSRWIIKTAIRTLLANFLHPAEAGKEGWYPYLPGWRGAAREIEFRSSWEPTIETEGMARKRLEKKFKAYLKHRFSEIGEELKKMGYEPAPKRLREEEKHLRWLVQFQVGGKTYPQIAKDFEVPNPEYDGRKTVSRGVENAAERIGLHLRERDQGGRPRKA